MIEGPGTGSKLLVASTRPPSRSARSAIPTSIGWWRDARGELAAGTTDVRHYGEHGEARVDAAVSVFIESFAPPPRMLIFGAVDFTAALARVAKLLGYRVTVCDAREVFATKRRFPMADEVVVDWPNRLLERVGRLGPRDAVCVLTHDVKFDVPAIRLRSPPTSATSAPWARGARTSRASSACAKRVSTMPGSRG